jgi:hypothetical protein
MRRSLLDETTLERAWLSHLSLCGITLDQARWAKVWAKIWRGRRGRERPSDWIVGGEASFIRERPVLVRRKDTRASQAFARLMPHGATATVLQTIGGHRRKQR